MSMTILIYGINFYPELTGTGPYNTEMCEYLKECGHNVIMVTGFPYYPDWRIQDGYKKKLFMKEEYNGIQVLRSYLYSPRTITTKARIAHQLSFTFSSAFSLLRLPSPDVVITVCPPFLLGLEAYFYCRWKNIPFVFHLQDLQVDMADKLEMVRGKRMRGFIYRLEKFILERANLVSAISLEMVEKIKSKGINPAKTYFFPNWVDPDFIQPLPEKNSFRKLHSLDNKFIVLYSGNVGIRQGLELVIEVARMTESNKEIVYLIVGEGIQKERLQDKVAQVGLKNVLFLPVQEREILPSMLSAADVSLIPHQKSLSEFVMPSKLLGIMASGRPVIAGVTPGTGLYRITREAQCGIAIEPENSQALYDAIMSLYKNPGLRKHLGENGRAYVCRNFSKNQVLNNFETKLLEVVAAGNK